LTGQREILHAAGFSQDRTLASHITV
jgi:hypothetical protein